MMFRPETYEDVRSHGTIGVCSGARKILHEPSAGDSLVAHVSRLQHRDGVGTITGKPFVDDTAILSGDKVYEERRTVDFDETGFPQPVGDTLWSVSCFSSETKTTPTNYVFCKGGIVELAEENSLLLVRVMKGDEPPKRFTWRNN